MLPSNIQISTLNVRADICYVCMSMVQTDKWKTTQLITFYDEHKCTVSSIYFSLRDLSQYTPSTSCSERVYGCTAQERCNMHKDNYGQERTASMHKYTCIHMYTWALCINRICACPLLQRDMDFPDPPDSPHTTSTATITTRHTKCFAWKEE